MPRTKDFQSAVPWRHAVAPGVILNSDQSLMRSYAIRGADLAGLSKASQGSMMQRLNLSFRRLPGKWSFHLERKRMQVRCLPPAQTDDPLLRRMDAQRRHDIVTKPSFESVYDLTIRRRPPVKVATMATEMFMTRRPMPRQVKDAHAGVSAFETAADHLAHLLSSILSACTPLMGDDLCTYLHTTCSDRWHHVAHPRAGAHLNYALCDARFIPGWEPMLGRWHVAFCSVVNFPHDSRASLLYRLDHLPFEHRQMTRWIAWPVATSRKLFRQTERAWVGKQQSSLSHFMASQGIESEIRDNHARNQAEDADAANQEVAGAYVGYGHWTSTVMVYGETVEEAETRINLVREVFEDEDFNIIVEDEHTLEAFLSMLPGDVKHSARKYPVSSINLAHMEPSLKAYWPGLPRDVDLQAGPWFLAHTEGSTLFRVANHTERHGPGHFAIIGPTGAGKSTLLSLMAASWLMQYDFLGARVVCLDIGRSMRALALCLGGQYDDLTDGTVQFQPLADIETPERRRIRVEWLLDRCADYDVPRTSVTEPVLRTAIDALAAFPMSQRTFKELSYLVAAKTRGAGHGITAVLGSDERTAGARATAKWEVQGQYKQINDMLDALAATGVLNGSSERFMRHRLHVIELGTLLDERRLSGAVLPYVQERFRSTFTGDPVLYLQDEHALQVTLPKQEDEVKRDLRSLRKMRVSLGIATHDVVDLFDTQMGKLILNSCKHALPPRQSRRRRSPRVAETYGRLGCTDTDIAELASLQPQEEYYVQQTVGNRPRRRKFAIPLRGLWLATCGSGTQDDHETMDQLLADGHIPGPDFAAAFVAQKALQWQDETLLAEARAMRQELG